MKIAVAGRLSKEQSEAFENSCNKLDFSWIAVDHLVGIEKVNPDLILLLECNGKIPDLSGIPILVNETVRTCVQIAPGIKQVARFCGWATFLERTSWEVAAAENGEWLALFEKALNRNFSVVKDTPGLVAPRILATIVNEACYGLGASICSAAAMDIAMKLGTNYPKGPLEWMETIGKEKFAELLTALANHDKRYEPHPLMLN